MLMLTVIVGLFLFSCEDWIDGTPDREDVVLDEQLVSASDIGILINGVEAQFSSSLERLVFFSELLADVAIFDSYVLANATYTSFQEIDEGYISLDNNSIDGFADNVGELWKHAKLLEDRIKNVITDATTAQENEALYVATFYEAVAYDMYAGYFGLNANEGGACIDGGEFQTPAELYTLAVATYKEALEYATDYEVKVINSLIARCYLYNGDYANAKSYADNGLDEEDDAFKALFSNTADNYVWQQGSSALRAQFYVDFRFHDYIVTDPTDSNRIEIEVAPSDALLDGVTDTYYLQTKYYTSGARIPYMTWQENNLILAELALRGQGGDALALVNAVRASHGISALSSIDMDGLIVERDKELFLRGQRLIDQRRFDGLWHLDDNAWHYLPIVTRERNNNPNID